MPKKTFSYQYILEQFFLQLVIIMLIVAQVHDMFFSSSILNKYEFLKVSLFLVDSVFRLSNDNNFKS
jgi:hypothetical protein